MIIVDASALVLALSDQGPRGAAARAELAADSEWAAPEHLLVEVMQSLRGLYLAKELTADRVAEIAAQLPGLSFRKVEVAPLLGRIWELKDNLTPDDAAYVAVAERFDAPLVTADLRLMRASGPRCEIRGIAPAASSSVSSSGARSGSVSASPSGSRSGSASGSRSGSASVDTNG